MCAFDSNIALGELEVTKAKERVDELKFQKARFNLDYINAVIKSQAAAQPGPAPVQG
jgi:hypothetical protein